MRVVCRLIRLARLVLFSPVVVLASVCALALGDLAWKLFGHRQPRADRLPATSAASGVIPNWNGRDLLERYLPSFVNACSGHPDNEIFVVAEDAGDVSA